MYYEKSQKRTTFYKILLAACIMLAVLIAAVPGARAADQDYAIVRVKLSVGTPSSLSFFADGNYSVAGTPLERQRYTVKLEGGSLKLYCGPDAIAGGSAITLVQHEPTAERNNFIYLYNTNQDTYLAYAGDMEFSIDSKNACIRVVNCLYIEEYLLGVVPYEMSDSWPVDALKAQAVAARNYVISNIGGSSYDVVDTSKDQVYKGYSDSLKNTLTAVGETEGEVLMYNGGNVEMFYSASNGGWTEIPQHVWTAGNRLYPYHVVKPDPYDIMNSWSVSEALVLPKTITESDVITYEYSKEGDMISVTDAQSSQIKNAQKCLGERALPELVKLGYNILDSIKGINSVVPHTHQGNHGLNDYSGSAPCVCYKYARISMNVLAKASETAEATPVTVEFDIDMTKLADDDSPYFVFTKHSSLRLFTAEETETEWRIWHRRYGHGIGISQRGAQQRAKDSDPGVSAYDRILEFYYPGAAIVKKGYEKPPLSAVTAPDHSNAAMTWERVNVRTGPGTSYDSIGRLPKGARIEVVEPYAASTSATEWHKILYGGNYAYVAASVTDDGKKNMYVRLDDPMPQRETYKISFSANGGSAVSSVNVLRGDSIAASPTASRSGYTFGGWYRDSSLKTAAAFPYIATRSATLYAKWNPVSYKITYDYGGGKASNPASYTPTSGAIRLNNPTRSGYVFTGWSGTGISGTAMSVTIPAGSAGNRAYTANWKKQSAYLAGLKLSAGSLSPSFSKTNYSYKIKLAENVGSVTITPVKDYEEASMSIAGKTRSSYKVSLSNGKSTNVYVKVKYGGTTKTYKFTVTRAKSTNNNLASLKASTGTFDSAFNPSDTSYILTLGENVKSTKITASAAAGKLAKVSPSSKIVSLKNGASRAVKIKVKSQAGKYKTYTIKVVRAPSTNNKLSYLKTSSKSLPIKPRFNSSTASYAITLPVNKSTVTISAKAAGYKAAVYIDGKRASSKSITLKAGESRAVQVKVIAQSKAERVYTINIARLISSDANLKSLKTSTSSVRLSPAFSPGITSYSISMPANKSYFTLYANASGYGAKVTFDGKSASSKKIALKNGESTTVRIVVKSQAGNTKEYVIAVRRP